jgi:hypothetical protein
MTKKSICYSFYKKSTERKLFRTIVEEVARIALEDYNTRAHISHQLNVPEKELEETYQFLCKL